MGAIRAVYLNDIVTDRLYVISVISTIVDLSGGNTTVISAAAMWQRLKRCRSSLEEATPVPSNFTATTYNMKSNQLIIVIDLPRSIPS
jgi:hypothetical protein